MSIEEEKESLRQQQLRELAFTELAERENEIYKMRDGLTHPSSFRKTTRRTEARAFRNYMKMIWRKPKVKKVNYIFKLPQKCILNLNSRF